MTEKRTCAGYAIIESYMPRNGDEIVIGFNEKQAQPYVCWYCAGGHSFYWGRYSSTYDGAKSAMLERMGVS